VPSNLVMTSGCGCTLVGARSGPGRGIAMTLAVLGCIILLLRRRKIRS
jgi:hypothetical protein